MNKKECETGENFQIGSFNVIGSDVQIVDNVKIGNNCTIDGEVIICSNVIIGNNVTIIGNVVIGMNVKISDGARLGGAPNISSQLDYKGRLEIGSDCYIGENVVITVGGKYNIRDNRTRIASKVLIMANSVIHHNCVVGFSELLKSNPNNLFDTTISTGVVMNGCCEVSKGANIGSGTHLHQFTHIGEGAMVAMGSSVVRDILPFTKFINGEIVGLNCFAIKNLAKELKLDTEGQDGLSFLHKELYEVMVHALYKRGYIMENAEKSLKRYTGLSDGLIYILVCNFILSINRSRPVAKGSFR